MWTLQEAVLARNLYVKYGDGVLDISATLKQVQKDVLEIDFHHQPLLEELLRYYKDLTFPQLKGLTRTERMTYAWNSGYCRSTSKSEDSMLVLASLLDVDISNLFDVSVEERFKRILSSQPEFSKAIVHLPGPRIQEDGCRWMVQSFAKAKLPDDGLAGIRHALGLVVTYPGFVTIPARASIGLAFSILDVQREVCYQALHGGGVQGDFGSNSVLGLLLQSPLGLTSNEHTEGVLVRIYRQEQGILFGTFEFHVTILTDNLRIHWERHIATQDVRNILTRHRKRLELGLPPINFGDLMLGTSVSAEQKWCVG